MRIDVDGGVLELIQGDITEQEMDAIVNAANSALAGGGGVDGAIHDGGGPQIMRETDRKYPDGCPTGSAVASGGGELAARYVLHAVGPVWSGGDQGEPELLALAHRRCLELAVELGCQSVAFPAISTGVYGYPMDQAARVAIRTVRDFFAEHDRPGDAAAKLGLVRFVLFSADALSEFERALAQ